jgi:cell division protein FtsW (lipid II flippase)
MAKTQDWPITRTIGLILVPVGVLVTAGMLAIYATERQATGGGLPHTLRQAVYLVVSLGLMAAAMGVPYQKIGRYAYPFFAVVLFMALLLVMVRKLHISPLYPVIPVVRGSARWIRLGTSSVYFQLQPSELMKLAFIMALARYLRFRSNYRTWLGLMPPFLLTLVPLMLILMEPDLGTALLMLPVLYAMLYVAGARILQLFLIILLGIAFTPIAWQQMAGYQRYRVLVLVGQVAPTREKLLPPSTQPSSSEPTAPAENPVVAPIDLKWYERAALALLVPTFREVQIQQNREAVSEHGLIEGKDLPQPPTISVRSLLRFNGRFDPDPQCDLQVRRWIAGKLADLHREQGYQLRQGKVALGSGGVFGKGPWEGTYVRYGFLPDRHNDFIFAVLGHQWGLVGCVVVLLMYLLIVLGGVEVAGGTDDPFGRLLAVGVVSLTAAQVVVNVGMTVGIMPITGMTLPFVSFGGSSLMVNFIAVGLLINVSQHRQLLIAHRPFEFGEEVQEQPASLLRWNETRR